MEALAQLRSLIAYLDQALVEALCARARFLRNESLYAVASTPPQTTDDVAGLFADAPTLAGRIRILRPGYLSCLLPPLCAPGADESPSACISADAVCLDALARRLALSVHVATRKRESIPESLHAAIQTGRPEIVERAITNAAVEEDVLARVRSLAAAASAGPGLPDTLASLYADWIIFLSRKIQVHGLLAGPI